MTGGARGRGRAATVLVMAGSGSLYGARRRWWRAPAMPRLRRRTATLVLLAVGCAAFGIGSEVGSAVRALRADRSVAVDLTELGPVRVHLPEDVGPWTMVPQESFDDVGQGDGIGGATIDGAWGAVAPGAVVVTVLSAEAGRHGGIASVRDSVPTSEEITWSGNEDHVAGMQVADGVRELILAAVSDSGDLVILSVSAPQDAFASGTLDEAFRTAQLDG
jgi:hypothetical protein